VILEGRVAIQAGLQSPTGKKSGVTSTPGRYAAEAPRRKELLRNSRNRRLSTLGMEGEKARIFEAGALIGDEVFDQLFEELETGTVLRRRDSAYHLRVIKIMIGALD
jgi:hypothetical protein